MTYQFVLPGNDIDEKTRILTTHLEKRGFSIDTVLQHSLGRDALISGTGHKTAMVKEKT